MKDPRQLTPAEFEIMHVLWSHPAELSVAQVLEFIRAKKSVAYTTVMTLLDKMARKGSVKRGKKGKAYLYSPRVERAEVLEFLTRRFVESYSLDSLVTPAASTEDIDVSLL